MDLSARQACLLWSQLEQAYYGDNSYGGNTAELYAYKFGVDRPENSPEVEMEQAGKLYSLLVLFASQRRCQIWVDGRRLGFWALKRPFVHRVHVRVERKGE